MENPAVIQVRAQIEQAIVSFIKQKVDKYIDAGEIRQVNSELVAYLLLKGYLAFVNDWNLTHEKPLTEKEITDFFKIPFFIVSLFETYFLEKIDRLNELVIQY